MPVRIFYVQGNKLIDELESEINKWQKSRTGAINLGFCRLGIGWPNLGLGLGFGQLAFPYDALVWFVDALDPVLVLAVTVRL